MITLKDIPSYRCKGLATCPHWTGIYSVDCEIFRFANLNLGKMLKDYMTELSPYIEHPKRLADVIALLQIMGTYRYANRRVESWEKTIGRSPVSAETWDQVIGEHPEFFRLKDGLAILVWRRSYDRSFDPDAGKAYTAEELERHESLPEEQQPSLTRQALTPDQITALIDSAIKMHAAAIAYSQEQRWRVPVLAGILGVLLGAFLNGYRTH